MAGLLSRRVLPRRDRRWPRDFHHRRTADLLNPLEAFELFRAFPPQAERDGARVPVVAADPYPRVGPGRIAVTWLGHASVLLHVDDVTLLVDPVLVGGIPGAPRRLTAPALTPDQLPPLDAVLISHDHYDHLDAPTLRRLPRSTPVLVGGGGAPWFARRGFTEVTELDWWESTRVGGVDVEFVPAHHWSRRTLGDTCRRLWGGWVVTGADGRSVVHAGDTGYGPFPGRIGARHPDIAIAVLPVGAYAPRRLLRGVHMDPGEAVRAAGDLGARHLVPVHWGTFTLSAEPVLEPLERVREEWVRAGRDRADLWDLPVGGTRVL
ncbi:MBL fold metallo-hydrolase [Actinomycetospora succinea]|uniref:MBL fold metallo-hydrolase n=1 Tax=Actinomycetospora succinea TaxID=663603 RepID=UPI001FB78C41|nr:MBL fold metallo-hydrolase [Actinomycetospora succinea]